IENSMLVIQNADFDLSFLLFESKKLEIPFPNLPVLCTLNMTRSLFPNYPKHGLAHLRKYFKIDTIKTSDRTDFHQALDDSYAAMKVFIYSADKANLWEKDISILNYHPKGFKTSSDFEI
ncbi:MAG TPA: 3'-5' exonuclease, partial [Leptospiraceae bacterium]|nr:3'-5' exonuclease [Leptospiraceae bacterium]